MSTAEEARGLPRLQIDPVGHGLLRAHEEEKRDESAEALTATARRQSPTVGGSIAVPVDGSSSAEPATGRALPVSALGSEGAETGGITESARAEMPGALAKSGSPPGSQRGGLQAPSGLDSSHHGTGLGQAQSQVNLGETKAEQLEAEIAAVGATMGAQKSAKSLLQEAVNPPSDKGDEEDK